MEKEAEITKLKKELGKSLTDIQDNTCFWFDNGFDGHDYSGKELKEDPTLVHWFWDQNKKEFLPLAVLYNQTAALYSSYEV